MADAALDQPPEGIAPRHPRASDRLGGAWPVIGSTGGLFSKADAREIRLDPKARSVYVISKAVRLGPLSIAKLKAIRST
jgi:hypothetical protein